MWLNLQQDLGWAPLATGSLGRIIFTRGLSTSCSALERVPDTATTSSTSSQPFQYISARIISSRTIGSLRLSISRRAFIGCWENQPGLSLFVSPGAGVKVHLTSHIGLMASVSYDGYLANAFDSAKNNYHTTMVPNLGINFGMCFQIPGW